MILSKIFKYKNLGLIFDLVLLDFVASALAWIITFNYRLEYLNAAVSNFEYSQIALNVVIVGIFWVLVYVFFGFYLNVFRKSRIHELLKIFAVSFIGCTLLFILFMIDDYREEAAWIHIKIFLFFLASQVIITATFKVLIITFIKNKIRKKKIGFNTLIVGSEQNALDIFAEIENSFDVLGFSLKAFVNVSDQASHKLKSKLKRIGDLSQLITVIRRLHIQHVIIAIEKEEHKYVNVILASLQKQNVKISILPEVYQYLIGSVKVNHIFDIPLVEIKQDLLPFWQLVLKRWFDILLALLVLTLGSPILVTIALITKFTSKGPIFYKQERIGKDGIPFNIHKYRSMYVNAEALGPRLSSEEDPRITKWGKFMRKTRIDEFPQFYNVLIGDMSIVGPRPERQFYIDQIVEKAPYYINLHKVKPGITSLGQVKFGYAENLDQMLKRLKYDILYIENMSLVMDLRIIFYTIVIMIEGRGK